MSQLVTTRPRSTPLRSARPHGQMAASKPLVSTGASGDEFQQKILAGRPGTSVNIDTIFHTANGYQVVEFLRDGRDGASNNPHTSHPSRYWRKNWRKFSALHAVAKKLDGTLWLINYSEISDNVRVFKVQNLVDGPDGGITAQTWDTTFEPFQAWYMRELVHAALPAWQ